jgi:hypothetical protein
MNCQAVQNKILAEPDPRRLPERIRQHVDGCAGCRAWAEQAARLEALVEELPAPAAPAGKKAALVGRLTRGEPIITRPAAAPAATRESRAVEFLRRNAAVIGGLAAAVLVALGAWALFPKNGPKPEPMAMPDDPFLRKMVERDVALARADTPARRLQVLGAMADDLAAQARGLARVASPDELRDLARWYDKVVGEALVKQAAKMHDGRTLQPSEKNERAETLAALARRLEETAAETDRLLGSVPPDSKPALQKIATAARDGQKRIQLTRVELTGNVEKGER